MNGPSQPPYYGVGKSTLLNGLLGVDTFHVECSLNHGTKKVKEEKFVKIGINVCLWDSYTKARRCGRS